MLTIPEFYERRFGRSTRVLGGVVLALGGILNMGLFLKVGSMFIVGITGLSDTGWALPLVMTGLLALVLVYTVLGGMISVIITDYVQFVVLSIGLLGTSLLAIWSLGWDTIFDTVATERGEAGFNPLVAESGFGVDYVMWMAFLGLVNCALWPTAVARALAMESTQAVRKQFMWSSISFAVRIIIPCLWGIAALVFIKTQATELGPLFDPDAKESISPLYAMPVFLGRILPAGIIGIMTAAMIAAFMSTHDSYLLCWSSVIAQDVVAPLKGEQLTAAQRVRLTRVLIVVIGAYIWVWGLYYKGRDDVWDYMAITGAIYFTGAFAVLTAGLYWSRASRVGAWGALLAGCTAVVGLEPIRRPLSRLMARIVRSDLALEDADKLLTGAHVGLASIGCACLAMVVGSLLFPDPPSVGKNPPAQEDES